jgi:hypothetical protein
VLLSVAYNHDNKYSPLVVFVTSVPDVDTFPDDKKISERLPDTFIIPSMLGGCWYTHAPIVCV